MKINAIITAGGNSRRYGNKNKLFDRCGSSCVLIESIKPFLEIREITKILIGIDRSFTDEFEYALKSAGLGEERCIVLSDGGATRTQTVKNALSSLEEDADYILVHDGARPYVTEELIRKVIACAEQNDVALPLLPMTDAVVDITQNALPVDRAHLRRVQTPFCAKKEILVKAYQNLETAFYDDLSAVKTCYSGEIGIVEGNPDNIKITYNGDIKHSFENAYLSGCGYDIHRLKKGNGIKLLGVFIPCEFGFVAHSDGDVPIHAIMDSILSALGEKDIGHFFPVDDPKYDGADSAQLLKEVLYIAKSKGYVPCNLSVTVIAERPMISPHIDDMRKRMSDLLGIDSERIGICATTNEQVGEIGNNRAIAAYSNVLLRRI